jgi:hypothetical protein
MFNTGYIDSLMVRVKLSKITVIDKRFVQDYIAYYPSIDRFDNDGNELERLGDKWRKAEPFVKIVNGITYRFYVKAFINPQKIAEEYVVFQVSAKMVKKDYFNGITADNYRSIVDDINSFGFIKISYESFLQGLVSDIDICVNQLIDEKSLKTAFSLIQNFALNGKLPLIQTFQNARTNRVTGMEFNKRERSTNAAPYCKIYHKGIELQSKSIDFYNAYLSPMRSSVLDNLVRYEYTIKAHKHKQYLSTLGLKTNELKTLFDLLKLSNNDLLKIAQNGLPCYLEKKQKQELKKEQSPTDIVLQYLVANAILNNQSEEQIFGFLPYIDCPVAKSRMRKKVKNLISDLTERNKNLKKQLSVQNRSNQFLKNLGI